MGSMIPNEIKYNLHYDDVPQKIQRKYRQYTEENMAKAYEAPQKGLSVYRVAVLYEVPEQTLRDRARGHIKPERRSSGPVTILSATEQTLREHVREMAIYAHGYSNRELRQIATYTVIYLDIWVDKENVLDTKWLKGFLRSRPVMKVLKPKSSSMIRAKVVS